MFLVFTNRWHACSATGEFTDGLRKINPFLSSSELKAVPSGATACADRKPWESCSQYVSLFSGLAVHSTLGGGYTFLGMTDRGPNVECSDFEGEAEDDPTSEWKEALDTTVIPASLDNGYGFPIKRFSPSFFKVVLDKATNKLSMGQSCYLKNTKGAPINGLGNLPGRDPATYGAACASGPFPQSQAGLDSEDIQNIPGRGHVAIVDEYGPSIVIAKGFNYGKKCGQVVARYVPTDSDLSTAGAGYPILKVLPALLSHRRDNRGMENLAVSADGKTLIAMLQSPLSDSDATELSPVVTAIRLDISRLTAPKVLGLHLYLTERAEEGATAWADDGEEAKDIKVSGFADAAPALGLPAGTPVVLALERASDQVKVFLVDFSAATNVLGKYGGDPLRFDTLGGYTATKAALTKAGISVARKVSVLDTGLIDDEVAPKVAGWKGSDKQEGVAVLNQCVLALGSDNDFGFGDDQSSLSVVHLSKCLKPLYAELRKQQG